MAHSMVTRLTAWYSASLFLILLGVVTSLYLALSKNLASEDEAFLKDRVDAIRTIIATQTDPVSVLKRRVEHEWASRRFEHVYVEILDHEKRVLIASPLIPQDLERPIFASMQNAAADGAEHIQNVHTPSGATFLVFSSAIPAIAGADQPGSLTAALNLNYEQELLGRYRVMLILVLAAGLILSIVMGTFLARVLFSPVQKIITKTREIRSSNLHTRLNAENMPSELKSLAQTINGMLENLEDSFSRLSQFSANLAHEIRTPINSIRGEIEVALSQGGLPRESSDLLLSVNQDVARIGALVDNLLFIAKSENPGARLQKARFYLRAEIANIFDFYEIAAQEKGINLKIEIDDSVEVQAEKTLFQRAINNILANAINYTESGGSIKAGVRASHELTAVFIEDTGCGIAASDLPKVFDRFFRADESRRSSEMGGFGLGLTIVKSIMTLHRGSIAIDSEPGRGTRVTLNFENC